MHSKRPYSLFHVVRGLLGMIGSFAYVILLAVINGSLGNLLASFIPILGALAIAKVAGAEVLLSYGLLFGLIVAFGLLRGLLRYFEQYSNHYIAFKLLAKIRNIVFKKLRVLCPAKLEGKQKGTILSLISADTETIEVFYAHTLSPLCIAIVSSLGIFLFVGFLASWYLALYLLLADLLIGALVPFVSSKTVRKPGVEYRKEFTAFNGYFLDAIRGKKEVILNGETKERKEKVASFTNSLLRKTRALRNRSLYVSSATAFLIYLLDFGMLGLGLYLVFSGGLSPYLMAVSLVALMSGFGPVLALANLPENLTQTFTSAARLLDLLEEKPAVADVVGKKDFSFESLQTEGVAFAYPKEKETLHPLDIEVKKGEIIGIQGESGCGKSTLLKLLLRFYSKQGGKILYNGTDIEDINTESLKKNVVMVSQSTYLFGESVEDNLRIAKPSATLEELQAAAKKAGIHELIMSLPDGYKTKVGRGGLSLSAGEKQRLGLARAFLSEAPLVLLDEPTSNIDAINEGIILRSIVENRKEKTFVLVSHRVSTMSIADRVYRFQS